MATASTASAARPKPRACGAIAYDTSVSRAPQSVRRVQRQPTSWASSRRTTP